MFQIDKTRLVLRISMLLASCLLIFACHRSGNESTGPKPSEEPIVQVVDFDLKKIKERGSLVAIVDNSSTGLFLYKGQPMGYEYDLLALFAKKIGVTLEIKSTTSIDKAFEMLNAGEGDVIAYSLTVTKARKKIVAFTENHYTARQVLIQKKPRGWRKMTREQLEKSLVRNQVELIGKEVHVRKSSSYEERLQNLSQEIGGDIIIIEDQDSAETEELIRRVAQGTIKYTVADETVAFVNAAYYPQIDVRTPISFPQQIAWAVRKNAPELLNEINAWMKQLKKQATFNVIYKKYFKSPRASLKRAKSDFSSLGGEKISVYDDIIKEAADRLGWDWRLLASQIYQESHFNPEAKSWAGAIGLMQLVPETGHRFGADDLYDPEQSIRAGVSYLRFLDKLWAKTVEDESERVKFVLASYNVGLGHVVDARELAKKHDKNPQKWDGNVEYYLLMKSKPDFFRDPVVKSGYCRGEEPVNYVREILSRFDQYKQLISS
ncbi:transporter substrate-binding domain-containing protein [Fulvivirga sp. 29W222]|uniref:Transporter substrate-binding domain-containing protein n=1 Tax=Fulvivirga marina TaxID=2494733 RepID=A0A937KC06_9BACT|nr:transporter substrate-binding domain-containing protein [Fulvivirga marina]